MSPKIIDISREIAPDSVVYPGDDPLEVSRFCTIDESCPCNITKLGWTTHFLTHVDPPAHFVKDGGFLDDVPLERFTGPALVIEVEGDAVLASDLPARENILGKNVLFKTANSTRSEAEPFDQNHVYISAEAAKAAVERGVNLVGIDYLSVDRFGDEEYPAHRTLLGNGVLILEGLNLAKVPPGEYTLIALPLKIKGGDGSPVRAALVPGGL